MKSKKIQSVLLGLVFALSALFMTVAAGCKITVQNTSGAGNSGAADDFVGEKLSADEWNDALVLSLGNFSMTNEAIESDGSRAIGAKCDFRFDGKNALLAIDADENTVESDAEGYFFTYTDGECRGYACENGVWTEVSTDGIDMTGEALFCATVEDMVKIGLFSGDVEATDGMLLLNCEMFAGFVFTDMYAEARYDDKAGTYTFEKIEERLSGGTQTERCVLRFRDKKIARIDYTTEVKGAPTQSGYGYGEIRFSLYDVGTTKITPPDIG